MWLFHVAAFVELSTALYFLRFYGHNFAKSQLKAIFKDQKYLQVESTKQISLVLASVAFEGLLDLEILETAFNRSNIASGTKRFFFKKKKSKTCKEM